MIFDGKISHAPYIYSVNVVSNSTTESSQAPQPVVAPVALAIFSSVLTSLAINALIFASVVPLQWQISGSCSFGGLLFIY